MSTRARSWITAALAVAVTLSAWLAYSYRGRPQPTPLQDFTAPFVFGRFTLPDHNLLTEESVELGRAGGEALRPSLVSALAALAELRLEQGRGTEAVALGRELLELLPADDPRRANVEASIARAEAQGDGAQGDGAQGDGD